MVTRPKRITAIDKMILILCGFVNLNGIVDCFASSLIVALEIRYSAWLITIEEVMTVIKQDLMVGSSSEQT